MQVYQTNSQQTQQITNSSWLLGKKDVFTAFYQTNEKKSQRHGQAAENPAQPCSLIAPHDTVTIISWPEPSVIVDWSPDECFFCLITCLISLPELIKTSLILCGVIIQPLIKICPVIPTLLTVFILYVQLTMWKFRSTQDLSLLWWSWFSFLFCCCHQELVLLWHMDLQVH